MWISLGVLSCIVFIQYLTHKTKYTIPYMYNKMKVIYNGYKTLDTSSKGTNILYNVFNSYVSKQMVTI